ncbi:MAG: glycosyltransferase family 4 protein [Candidatus Nanoarchaeia archaeon]
MKHLKVFINPGIHPQFREIIDFPPEDVEYVYDPIVGDHNNELTRRKREVISFVQRYLQVPRMAKIENEDKFDLIHSTRGILIRNKKPWVIDLESGAAFSGLEWTTLKKPRMRRLIRKYLSSPYCKKIMPQSEAARKTLLENVDCFGFEDKIETVYLAYHTTKLERKKSDKVRLSFIGRGFFEKGGNDVQEAFKILDKKYPGKLQLKVKCNVPEDHKLDMNNVIYLPKIDDPLEFYKEIFGDCDIYVQPTTVDSFGVTILEAMSTGLPIVCTDDFTLPELVEDGHNGFLVKSPVHWYPYGIKGEWKEYTKKAEEEHPETVQELVEKISLLIENPKLREKMGKNSFDIVESGKFSIKERNKKLRKIYDEALR